MKTNTLASESIQCRLTSYSNWTVRKQTRQPKLNPFRWSLTVTFHSALDYLFVHMAGTINESTQRIQHSKTIRIREIRRPSSSSPAPAPHQRQHNFPAALATKQKQTIQHLYKNSFHFSPSRVLRAQSKKANIRISRLALIGSSTDRSKFEKVKNRRIKPMRFGYNISCLFLYSICIF